MVFSVINFSSVLNSRGKFNCQRLVSHAWMSENKKKENFIDKSAGNKLEKRLSLHVSEKRTKKRGANMKLAMKMPDWGGGEKLQ